MKTKRDPNHSSTTRTLAGFAEVWACAFLCAVTSPLATAQERFLLEGIVDAELYKTDAHSLALAKNDGNIAALGRLQLWSAFQIASSLQVYALGEFEVDNSNGEGETDSDLQQLALRYSNNASPYYVIEAGKILPPIAIASERRLSSRNPLIGQPNFLYAQYPLGIQIAGSSGWFDFRAALVDLPAIDPDYLPAGPDSALRPDLGVGVTPLTGLRFGVAYTKGAYLNEGLNSFLPAGSGWQDFDQQLLGFEFQFSHGYLELNSELLYSEYEIPFQSEAAKLKGYFLELKYAWTPRIYGAIRLQRNEYPFIRHVAGLTWSAQEVAVNDLELGLAYRFTPDTQLKVAYRHDHTNLKYAPEYFVQDGHSLSLQLSHHFDVKSWFLTQH